MLPNEIFNPKPQPRTFHGWKFHGLKEFMVEMSRLTILVEKSEVEMSCNRIFWFDKKNKFLGIQLPVYLHLIFEISSVTRFFSNFEISSLKIKKINLITKLIFAGYTGSKNQVRTQKK